MRTCRERTRGACREMRGFFAWIFLLKGSRFAGSMLVLDFARLKPPGRFSSVISGNINTLKKLFSISPPSKHIDS